MDLYHQVVLGKTHEKRAGLLGGLLHAGSVAAAGHAGTNMLGAAAHHASNIGEVLAHKGLQHGMLGQRLTPVMHQSIKSIFGPESLLNYEAAANMGKRLIEQHPHPDSRLQAMDALTHHVSVAEGTPISHPLQQALKHHLRNTTPELQSDGVRATLYGKILNHLTSSPLHGAETKAQVVVKNLRDAIPAALTVGADMATTGVPFGALGHFAWNGVRQAAGHTDVGRKMIAREVAEGLAHKVPTPLQRTVINHAVSPAFLDARDLGVRARNQVQGTQVQPFVEHTLKDRGRLVQHLEGAMDKHMGEPAVRVLPHIKIEAPPRAPQTHAPMRFMG